MRIVGFLFVAGTFLAACSPTSPNDGESYFDKINPTPSDLERTTPAIETTVQPAVGADTTVAVDLQPVAATNTNSAAISDSQDFQAVKARETIETDAAKLDALKNNYEIVQPGAAPTRDNGVNLAKFALAQTNPVGQKIYSRFNLTPRKGQERCANYITVDDAQTDFLNLGGPTKDKLGLDPDGDGYACGWSPSAYRSLIGQ